MKRALLAVAFLALVSRGTGWRSPCGRTPGCSHRPPPIPSSWRRWRHRRSSAERRIRDGGGRDDEGTYVVVAFLKPDRTSVEEATRSRPTARGESCSPSDRSRPTAASLSPDCPRRSAGSGSTSLSEGTRCCGGPHDVVVTRGMWRSRGSDTPHRYSLGRGISTRPGTSRRGSGGSRTPGTGGGRRACGSR